VFGILLALIIWYLGWTDLSVNKEIKFRAIIQQEVKKVQNAANNKDLISKVNSLQDGNFSWFTYKIERKIWHDKEQSYEEFKIYLQDTSGNKLSPEVFETIVSSIYSTWDVSTSSWDKRNLGNNSYKWNNILIYYGWPSVINGSKSIHDAENYFKKYEMVILGAWLENSSHQDYENTKKIIGDLQWRVDFYGYVSPGESTVNYAFTWLVDEVLKWKKIWAKWVFIDAVGYDYFGKAWLSKSMYIAYVQGIVNYAKLLGLKVVLNMWNPDDAKLFKLNSDDTITIESYYYGNGQKTSQYIQHASKYLQTQSLFKYKPKLLCIATAGNNNQTKVNEIAKEIWGQMQKDCFYYAIQDDFWADTESSLLVPQN